MSQNVEFTNLKRKLEKVNTISEKISILEQLIQVAPTYPFLAMQKKKFKRQLESLKLGSKKRSRPVITQNIYQFRLTSSGNTINPDITTPGGTAIPWKLVRVDYLQQNLGFGKGGA